MIIEAPYKIGDTVSIKLASGEEIVTRLEAESDENIVVSRPVILAATQEGITFAPYMFTVENTLNLRINPMNVVAIAKTDRQISAKYIENTTGIVTSPAQGLNLN